MDLQHLLTALIVLASAAYASWALMPARWRQVLARRLLRRELPTASGCGGGCSGCGPAAPASAAAPAVKPITVHRRLR